MGRPSHFDPRNPCYSDRMLSSLRRSTAVSQCLCPEADSAKWIFPQERATFHRVQKRIHSLRNRSSHVLAFCVSLLLNPACSLPAEQAPALHFPTTDDLRHLKSIGGPQ